MIVFFLAVLFLLITPGPGVLSTAGVGAAFGFRAGLARNVLLIMSTVYLFYLAVRIAFAGRKIAFISAAAKPGLRAGVLLQLINPKAYAVNLTWFSGFVLLPESLLLETLLKFLIINLVWIPIHLLWLLAGSSVNQLDLSPRSHFLINAAMATAMLAVVVLAIVSLLGPGTP